MAINVYWACLENQWMLANEPDSVSQVFYEKKLYDKNDPQLMLNACPAFNKNFTNLFALRSLYDYEFTIEPDGHIHTKYYDQKFFEDHVVVRSAEKRMFSFCNRFIFFTDAPSLNATFYEYPYLEDNNITERCMMVTGQHDIGKWFRNTEWAFWLKKNYNTFKIERNEIYSYVRFHTDQKIKFKQFKWTDKCKEYNNDGFGLNFYGYMKTMENFYKNFRTKKLILKEIKENLL